MYPADSTIYTSATTANKVPETLAICFGMDDQYYICPEHLNLRALYLVQIIS
jgi:hypothetical protein